MTVMKGNAQVPEEKIFEIIEILYPYRLVESQLNNEAMGIFRRHGGIHDPADGIARAQAEQHKENGHDDKEDHQYLDQSFKDEFSDFHVFYEFGFSWQKDQIFPMPSTIFTQPLNVFFRTASMSVGS